MRCWSRSRAGTRALSPARIRDAFGRTFTITALTVIDGISDENAERFTSFIVTGANNIGRLIQFAE